MGFFVFLNTLSKSKLLTITAKPPSMAQEQQIIRKMSEGQGGVGNPPIMPALSGPGRLHHRHTIAPVPVHPTLHLDLVLRPGAPSGFLTGVATPVLPSSLLLSPNQATNDAGSLALWTVCSQMHTSLAGPFSVPALPTRTLLPEHRSPSELPSVCRRFLYPAMPPSHTPPFNHQLLLLFPLWDPQKRSPSTGSPPGRAFSWDSATRSPRAPSASAMSSFPLDCTIPQKKSLRHLQGPAKDPAHQRHF